MIFLLSFVFHCPLGLGMDNSCLQLYKTIDRISKSHKSAPYSTSRASHGVRTHTRFQRSGSQSCGNYLMILTSILWLVNGNIWDAVLCSTAKEQVGDLEGHQDQLRLKNPSARVYNFPNYSGNDRIVGDLKYLHMRYRDIRVCK